MVNPRKLLILLALAATGAVISIFQVHHFYEVRSGTAGFKSFCSVGAFDCVAIDTSPYAELLFGLPLAAFAAAFFFMYFGITWLARNALWQRDAIRALKYMSFVGTAFSLFYLYVMMAKLKTYCMLCLGVDAVNFASLGVVLLAAKEAGLGEAPPEKEHWKSFAYVGIISLALGLLVALGFGGKQEKRVVNLEDIMQSFDVTMPVDVPTPDTLPSLGPKNAKVTIVKFSDFQCPACRMGAFAIHPVLKRFKEQVRFVYRAFPLDPTCNRMIKNAVHQYACMAAKAAICANGRGKFAELYEGLFEDQSDINEEMILALGEKHGIPRDEMKGCLASPETTSHVKGDVEMGIELQVSSTPTFFVNGRRIEGTYPPEAWTAIISKLLDAS